MKVLHVLEATQGGTRRHVLDLLPALSARGVRCQLVYSSRRYPRFVHDASALEKHSIETRDLPMARGWNPTLDSAALRLLIEQIRGDAPDVLHCHSTKAGLLGRLAILALQSTLARRIPLVYTPHCVAFDTGLPRNARIAARWTEKLLAPLTSHFIAVSHHEARALHHVVTPRHNRLSVIHNGIDLDVFDSLASVHPAPENGHFNVACFGRLSAQKNQRALLAAWPRIKHELPGARLHFIGGGEDQSTLEQLARSWGMGDSITFAGEITEPRPLYRNYDLLVQPSRWEGCPYSVLEAMAARRAVVAADVGGLREVLGKTGAGVLCRPCSSEVIVAHTLSLAKDSDCRKQLGNAARHRIETHFLLQTMVEKTLTVYERVME